MKQFRLQITMCDFVRGGCEVVKESNTFLTFWLATKRNPCLVCGYDKLQCVFYNEMIDNGLER